MEASLNILFIVFISFCYSGNRKTSVKISTIYQLRFMRYIQPGDRRTGDRVLVIGSRLSLWFRNSKEQGWQVATKIL